MDADYDLLLHHFVGDGGQRAFNAKAVTRSRHTERAVSSDTQRARKSKIGSGCLPEPINLLVKQGARA